MPRHLPPTAVPITPSELRQALTPPAQALARFQTALSQYLGGGTCKLAASGRTALYLLLKGLHQTADHPARREVLMPAYTCPALAKVALDAQLQPRFIDISPSTLAFQSGQLEGAVNQRTLAIILVHPFGIPQLSERPQALANAVGAVLIEDAAQALGARLEGQPVGSRGDFGLFSLGPGKPLSTGGGGILCTMDDRHTQLIEQAWEGLPTPSVAGSLWSVFRLILFTLAFHPFGWWLASRAGAHRIGDHEASWGYTLGGLGGAQAALGLMLLRRLDDINRQRRENACRIIARLRELDFVRIPTHPKVAEPIYLRLPVLVEDEERRDHLFRRLWTAGVGVGRMYQHPLPDLFPQFSSGTYPGASYIARHLLTLPTHHYLTDDDLERITHIFETTSHAM